MAKSNLTILKELCEKNIDPFYNSWVPFWETCQQKALDMGMALYVKPAKETK